MPPMANMRQLPPRRAQIQQLIKQRRTQPRNGIPPGRGIPARIRHERRRQARVDILARAARRATVHDIRKPAPVALRVQPRVQEAQRRQALGEARIVEQTDERGEGRRRGAGAGDQDVLVVVEDVELVALRRDVGEAAAGRVVEALPLVFGEVFLEVGGDGGGLVGRARPDVGEAA